MVSPTWCTKCTYEDEIIRQKTHSTIGPRGFGNSNESIRRCRCNRNDTDFRQRLSSCTREYLARLRISSSILLEKNPQSICLIVRARPWHSELRRDSISRKITKPKKSNSLEKNGHSRAFEPLTFEDTMTLAYQSRFWNPSTSVSYFLPNLYNFQHYSLVSRELEEAKKKPMFLKRIWKSGIQKSDERIFYQISNATSQSTSMKLTKIEEMRFHDDLKQGAEFSSRFNHLNHIVLWWPETFNQPFFFSF